MTELALELDSNTNKSICDLCDFYGTKNKVEIFSKAIALLKVAAHVEKTQGELFARKGTHETKIIVR